MLTGENYVTDQNLTTDEELQDRTNYTIDSLESEIRADRHCAALLKHFHRHLLEDLQIVPLEAGALAAGADYFLREFLIGGRRENILEIPAERIRQFGGNWYIIRNLEPNIEELSDMIRGTEAFYRYCASLNMVSSELAKQVAAECDRLDFFKQRIEDFHAIVGEGYKDWDSSCPLD